MFEEPGLYIKIDDRDPVMLTNENIKEVTLKYWNNPQKIPPELKEHPAFKKCPSCPYTDPDMLCAALQPILPLLDTTDNFHSHSNITAYYRCCNDSTLHTLSTNFQNVFKYIAMLSLMHFCGTGRKFWKYYMGIQPLMSAEKITNTLYLNIFWLNDGHMEHIERAIQVFNTVVKDISLRQMERLKHLVKSDVILNSIVMSQSITEL